jgi:tRNA U34 5-carboxymethylaminomethyl modifying enzyme MnmG/GidA
MIIDFCHNGPPASGHAGVAAGRMAGPVGPRTAVVRLLAPIRRELRCGPAMPGPGKRVPVAQ